ncbi:hypothetical protein Tco_0148988 [Tanacetum coccineum]
MQTLATSSAAAQPNSDNYYEAPVPQRSNAPSYKQSSSTRTSASTRHKGKEIAKPVHSLQSDHFEEDSDPEHARRDNGEMQKNFLHSALTAQDLDTMPGNCREAKSGLKTVRYLTREDDDVQTSEQGVPLRAEQARLARGYDEEIDLTRNWQHINSYKAKNQESHLRNQVQA